MTHTYQVAGITCGGCQNKVKSLLLSVENVQHVDVSLAEGTVSITMNKHIPTAVLKDALKDYPKYQLSEISVHQTVQMEVDPEHRSWLDTYKPILLIFSYILIVALISGQLNGGFEAMTAMRIFMSGFFLTFSFFKLLNLEGFADSYKMYDIVAKRFHPWSYIYVFIELGLGIAYAINIQPFLINFIALVVMGISLIGVLQSVLNKKKIKCACLGAVFNLPMSTVTIVEDGLMILMSTVMLVLIK